MIRHAGKAAEEYAKANGMVTIGMTRLGKETAARVTNLDIKTKTEIWDAASRKFAESVKGDTVHVFIRKSAAQDVNFKNGVWMRVEKPILQSRGIRIIEHYVD